MLIVDTEANIETFPDRTQHQSFRLGYAIHVFREKDRWHEHGHEFHSLKEFWNLLDKYSYEKKTLYVFAHNLKYDYAILKLDTYLSKRKMTQRLSATETVFIVKAVTPQRDGNITFISTTNFYRDKLEKLAIAFGLPKLETPDFLNCSDSVLMPYCQRDAEALTNILRQHIDFIVSNDLGSFKPTIAGQAFTAFRHRFMHHKILVHDYPELLDMARLSYRGGRCEAFRMGSFSNVHVLDINSMYPFVMREYGYPIRPHSSKAITDISLEKISEGLNNGHFLVADCTLDLRKPVIAFKSERLLFPIGKFRQVITSPEFEYLLDNPDCGSISKVHRCVFYEKAKIFTEYVDFFYGIRKSTDNPAVKEMTKVLLNSLYGKMGQRDYSPPVEITDEKLIRTYFDIMDMEHTHEVFVGGSARYIRKGETLYYVEHEDIGYARESVPEIASAVTSYARSLLWSLIERAGKENVLYCDTDSLFVNECGKSNLKPFISQTELGKLKLVESGSCTIRGAKDYTFNGKVKLKGVKSNAEKLSENEYRQYQFQTGNLRYFNGTPDGIVVVKPVIKKLSRIYTKGTVQDSGEVLPLVMSEG